MNYPFADRAAEDERLVAQGVLFDPLTRRLLQQAGLAPGMRVLDLGSGAGNVARLAAGLVRPRGSVVGIERDPAAVALAQRRTDAANVEFRVGDVQTLEGVDDGFDAVVGRLVLMYLPDPIAALRRAATRARPGGLICLHEADLSYLWANPQAPLWAQVRGWLVEALDKAGVASRMGPSLFTTFRAARLPGRAPAGRDVRRGRPGRPGLGLGQCHFGTGPADGAAGSDYCGRGGRGHAGRPPARGKRRPRRLRHRPPDDRGLGHPAHSLSGQPGQRGGRRLPALAESQLYQRRHPARRRRAVRLRP
jgi:SAM-dependent methyltransferase